MASRALSRLHQPRDPYPVLMGAGLLARAGPLLSRLWGKRRVAVVTHRRLDRLIGARLRRSLRKTGIEAAFLFMPEGERFKNLDTVRRLYDRLIRCGFHREDGLVALGGGVVGDTTGFLAATYLRGLDYIQIPTTLLAQIDSAIGAKVGVNHPRGKNLVGAFHRPAAVLIDPELLVSLPAREFRSGLFEMLKYGFIGSRPLFHRMERSPGALRPSSPPLERAIRLAARLKLRVVRSDERETGLRRTLNFGHTVGHGLEAAGGYRLLSHGEAVGWGMIAAARLAARRGLIGPRLLVRMESTVRRIGPLPQLARLRTDRVLAAIEKDKKAGPEGLRFVLPSGIGRVKVVPTMPLEEIRWALKSLGVGGG